MWRDNESAHPASIQRFDLAGPCLSCPLTTARFYRANKIFDFCDEGLQIKMDHVRLLGRQIVAARTLLGLTQSELATAACISIPTLKRMEGLHNANFDSSENDGAVRSALQLAGAEFICEHGGISGVRLKAAREVVGARSSGPASDAVDKMDAAIAAHRLDDEMRRSPVSALEQLGVACRHADPDGMRR